jgi:hypothetical protein
VLLQASGRVYGCAPPPTEYGTVDFPPYGVTVVTLAHQGGWDEVGMVVVPLLFVALLLVVANRRANQEQARRRGGEGGHR